MDELLNLAGRALPIELEHPLYRRGISKMTGMDISLLRAQENGARIRAAARGAYMADRARRIHEARKAEQVDE